MGNSQEPKPVRCVGAPTSPVDYSRFIGHEGTLESLPKGSRHSGIFRYQVAGDGNHTVYLSHDKAWRFEPRES